MSSDLVLLAMNAVIFVSEGEHLTTERLHIKLANEAFT